MLYSFSNSQTLTSTVESNLFYHLHKSRPICVVWNLHIGVVCRCEEVLNSRRTVLNHNTMKQLCKSYHTWMTYQVSHM